ncbi:phosphatase PAP2 family protein [Blautia sp.]|jgi:membrane-associated phospholipid phosphatase|uniref:phosphatase PAP2 family protein n=1 Tax=Blautia sp. TaxID=1955243 RepID=UPI002943B3F3|nr:phosphatase PAP2 family protein [Blautia sp.]MDY3017103.1 phosphatase PAP2 family protein [Blautia sp.]
MEFLNFLARYRTPAADAVFQGITLLAQETFVVAVICWLFWCAQKKLAYCLGFSYFTSGLLVQGLKITFRVPRPWILDPSFQPVASAVPGATGYSFPSGHTQSITALLGTLGFYFKKNYQKLVCALFIFLVGFSRMYLGCHTPQDVLVSFGVSILCVSLCWHFLYKKEIFHKRNSLVSVFMAVVCLGLLAYTLTLYKHSIIEFHYAQDCVKACGAGAAFAAGYYITEKWIPFHAPDSVSGRIRRFLIGIFITLLLQTGLKPLIGESLPASFIRYFIVVFWVITVYPFLFYRKEKQHSQKSDS